MGIDAEKIDEIIEMHAETINALKEQRDGYKADAEKLVQVQKELDDLKKAVENNGDNPYEAKYNSLKDEFDAYKSSVDAEKLQARQSAAYKKLLRDAGVSKLSVRSSSATCLLPSASKI